MTKAHQSPKETNEKSTLDSPNHPTHDSSLLQSQRRKRIRTRLNTVWGKLEHSLGRLIPFQTSFWRSLKVFICQPLIIWALYLQVSPSQIDTNGLFKNPSKLAFWAFFAALFFDFLRQSKATYIDSQLLSSDQKEVSNESSHEQVEQESSHTLLSRLYLLSDFTLSLFATYTLFQTRPELLNFKLTLAYMLVTLLVLDLLSLILSFKNRGPKKTRLRAMMNGVISYVLLGLTFGFTPHLITLDNATILLTLQTMFLALVFAYQVRLLQKRFIADTLSGLNFICGLISIYYSLQGKFETSLLFLLLGAAFDGFDGAAARKFGGTKFGVYSDDIADGMNYGIAPAFAVYALMQGVEGLIIGTFYAVFTLSRLVYFTLNKDEGDPGYFAGVPSPVGGMIVMSSVVLFTQQVLWVSFLVGVSSTLMVSFKTPYVHVFRAFSWRSKERRRQALIGGPLFLITFLFVTSIWGTKGAAAVILSGACLYGFIPSILSFYFVLYPPEDSIEE